MVNSTISVWLNPFFPVPFESGSPIIHKLCLYDCFLCYSIEWLQQCRLPNNVQKTGVSSTRASNWNKFEYARNRKFRNYAMRIEIHVKLYDRAKKKTIGQFTMIESASIHLSKRKKKIDEKWAKPQPPQTGVKKDKNKTIEKAKHRQSNKNWPAN